MNKRRTKGEKVFAVFNNLFLGLLVFVFLIPIWHVLMASFSNPEELQAHMGLVFYPLGGGTTGGYELVLTNQNILRAYLNSVVYLVGATGFATVMSILAAYGLSRKNLYFKKPIMLFLSFTMIFSGGIVPTYMVVRSLKLVDTIWALIIPGTVSVYYIIILRTSFAAVPDSLIEAAKIDGAGHFYIMTQVVLPVSKSAIAVIVLFYAIRNWNAWFNASIYLQKRRDLYPLQLALREVLLQTTSNAIVAEGADMDAIDKYRPLIKYSTIAVSILPMLVIYPFVQRFFVKGVMIGSIKE